MADGDDEKPSLKLVSENAHLPNRAVLYAKAEAERALVVVAANFLRAIAGSDTATGDLRAGMIRAILAEEKYRELSGNWLASWEKQKALALPQSDLQAGFSDDQYRDHQRNSGMEDIVQGALRLAAHQVLDERPHFGGKYSKRLIDRGIEVIREASKQPHTPPMTKKARAQSKAAWATVDVARDLDGAFKPLPRKKPWSSRDSRSYLDPKGDD
jgi:hypothetical protein